MEASEIGESSSVTIYGMFVLWHLCLKTSRTNSGVKFFEGRFTDVSKVVGMVYPLNISGEEVEIENCAVKESNMSGDKMESFVAARQADEVAQIIYD